MSSQLEEIMPPVRPTLWTLDAKIHIDYTKTNAEKYHDKTTNITLSRNKLTIYTDGSGIERNIGATPYCPTLQMKHQYLGEETTHNVYAAELEARMALDIAQHSRRASAG